MLPENATLLERPNNLMIPMQEGTFLLYPDNQQFLKGERSHLTAIDLGKRHILLEIVFLYGMLFLALLILVPLMNLFPQNFGIIALVSAPFIVWIGMIMEKQINLYNNKRITKRYQREGKILQGVLESAARGDSLSWEGGKLKFTYTITTPSGTRVQGKLGEKYSSFGKRPIPAPDTPVMVLYFSDAEHYLL
jgi:hypothetical protein